MCLAYRVNINARNSGAPRSLFVNCGVCEECRAAYKQSWCFRLTAELQDCVLKHWNVCFFTLTYNDLHLPTLPESVYKDKDAYWIDKERGISRGIPCFSRDDVEDFVRSVRKWLHREYRVADVRYMVCAEYGSSERTNRPHYHGIIAVPPKVDTDFLHGFICRKWHDKGFVFPRFPHGGIDSEGYEHKPFVVSCPLSAARYCAKYTTKDLFYYESLWSQLSPSQLDIKSREFKRCMTFHVQTRQLGLHILDNMTDEQRMDVLRDGFSFFGEEKKQKLPVYYRNKIFFDVDYTYEATPTQEILLDDDRKPVVDEHGDFVKVWYYKRVVGRKPTEFLRENYKELFWLKAQKYGELIQKVIDDPSCMVARGVPRSTASLVRSFVVDFVGRYDCTATDLASYYCAYYGVPDSERYAVDTSDLPLQWLYRYEPQLAMDGMFDYARGWHSEFIEIACNVVGLLINAYFLVPQVLSEEDKAIERVKDFFKHRE